MPRWMRALLIAAAAAAAAALVFSVVPAWKEASRHGDVTDGASDGPSDDRRPQTHEEVIAALSDEQKERMLRELGHHV